MNGRPGIALSPVDSVTGAVVLKLTIRQHAGQEPCTCDYLLVCLIALNQIRIHGIFPRIHGFPFTAKSVTPGLECFVVVRQQLKRTSVGIGRGAGFS